MAARMNFSGFPDLVINPGDVSNSWKRWRQEFLIAIELKTMELGTKIVESAPVENFTDRAKLLVLFRSIGQEGRDALTAMGFNVQNTEATYQQAWDLLDNHYEREDSIYMRTQKCVTVSQLSGEEERDYLLRVERLSRAVELVTSNDQTIKTQQEQTRSRFAVVLAVNGLRDQGLRRELMQKKALTWEKLAECLRSRYRANVEVATYPGYNPPVSVKQEVGEVASTTNQGKSQDNDGYEGSVHSVQRGRTFEPEWLGRTSRSKTRSQNEGRTRSPSNQRYEYRDSRTPRGDSVSPSWRDKKPYDTPRMERMSSPSREMRVGSPYNDAHKYRDYSSSPRRNHVECFICGKGHMYKFCPSIQCHKCGGRGHIARDCGSRSPNRSVRQVNFETESKLYDDSQ